MSEEFLILFNENKCIQCRGCETACKSWRSVEPGVKWRRVDNLWHGHYPQVKSTSLSLACMHCAEPACIAACPVGAINKRLKDGIVSVDREACIGCLACLEACSFHVPQFGADGTMQKCDFCADDDGFSDGGPPCVITCPTKALRYKKVTTEEKILIEQSLKEQLIDCR